MDTGGTIPRKESVESSQERRSRTMPGAIVEDVEAFICGYMPLILNNKLNKNYLNAIH